MTVYVNKDDGIVVNRNKPPPVSYDRTSSASYRNLV